VNASKRARVSSSSGSQSADAVAPDDAALSALLTTRTALLHAALALDAGLNLHAVAPVRIHHSFIHSFIIIIIIIIIIHHHSSSSSSFIMHHASCFTLKNFAFSSSSQRYVAPSLCTTLQCTLI
jgi:hypothetical protein